MFLIALIFSSFAMAAPVHPHIKAFPKELSQVVRRYTNSHSLQMDVEKDLKLAMLDKETSQQGRIYISNGRLRVEFEENLVVVDKKNIWLVTYPSKELGGSVQVGRARRSSGHRAPILLKLLSQKGLEEDFNVVQTPKVAGEGVYVLVPKKRSPDFKRVAIDIDLANQTIIKVTYWDEIDNETSYKFIKTEWNPKLSPQLFHYVPPPGVKVTLYN